MADLELLSSITFALVNMWTMIARLNSEVEMRAQLLTAARRPLVTTELPAPRPGPHQLLIAVRACAVCRTDLHVVDGELADPQLPLVPGPPPGATPRC